MAQGDSSLFRILKQHREYYPLIVVYSVFISFLTLATPISVQSLVNTFSFGPYFQPLFILSLLLFGLLTVLGIVKSLQYLIVEYLQRRLYARLTSTIVQASLFDQKTPEIELKNKLNRYFDVVLIQKTLAFLITDGISIILGTVIGLVLICLYHPFFIPFSLIILLAITAPVYFLIHYGKDSAVGESSAKYDVANFLEELPRRTDDRPLTEQVDEADTMITHYLDRRASHFRLLFTQNILYMVCFAVLNAILLALGGYLVISNQLTVGQLVAAEIVVNSILSQCLYAKKYLDSYYDMFAAAEKLEVFFDLVDRQRKNHENSEIEECRALTKLRQSDFNSVKSVYAPTNYKNLIRNFSIAVVSLLLILAVVPWFQTSRGYGKVTAFNPNDRAQSITAPVSGRIETWLIQDGQEVKEGDPIVRIIDNDPNFLVRLEAGRDAAVANFEAAKEASDTARLNFHRQEQLVKEGLSSRKEFEESKIKYKKLLADEAKAAASLAKAEVSLSRQQMQLVTAPRDGRILRILHGSGNVLVKSGEDLVSFVPKTDDNAVEIFVDGNDLPLVTQGRHVRLQFEGWPSVQFSGWPSVAIGSFGGIVQAVDPSVSDEGRFRILVVPDPEDPNGWPDERFLRQGARTLGLVLLDQVSLGYEIWRQINGFPKSLPKPPEPVGKKNPKWKK